MTSGGRHPHCSAISWPSVFLPSRRNGSLERRHVPPLVRRRPLGQRATRLGDRSGHEPDFRAERTLLDHEGLGRLLGNGDATAQPGGGGVGGGRAPRVARRRQRDRAPSERTGAVDRERQSARLERLRRVPGLVLERGAIAPRSATPDARAEPAACRPRRAGSPAARGRTAERRRSATDPAAPSPDGRACACARCGRGRTSRPAACRTADRWDGSRPAGPRPCKPGTRSRAARGSRSRASSPRLLLEQLPSQLEERLVAAPGDRALLHRALDRAIGLAIVRAVDEPALAEKRRNSGYA